MENYQSYHVLRYVNKYFTRYQIVEDNDLDVKGFSQNFFWNLCFIRLRYPVKDSCLHIFKDSSRSFLPNEFYQRFQLKFLAGSSPRIAPSISPEIPTGVPLGIASGMSSRVPSEMIYRHFFMDSFKDFSGNTPNTPSNIPRGSFSGFPQRFLPGILFYGIPYMIPPRISLGTPLGIHPRFFAKIPVVILPGIY